MKTLYFKTASTLLKVVADHKKTPGVMIHQETMQCKCGDTVGFRLLAVDYKDDAKLILCPSCYDNALIMERGER